MTRLSPLPEPRVGIIGTGHMAQTHAAAWNRIGVSPVAVLARSERPAPEGLERARVFTDTAAFFAAVDVVDICTPTDSHVSYALAAADAGLPTMCEKPLARTAEEAADVVRVFATRGVPFQVGQVLRFHSAYAAAREAVALGRIGEPILLRLTRLSSSPTGTRPWFADAAKSGGVIADLMVHDMDFARWVAGEVESVSATVSGRSSVHPGLATSAVAVLTHRSGAVSRIEGSWDAPFPGFESGFDVIGDAATVSFEASRRPLPGLCRAGNDRYEPLIERADDRLAPFARAAAHFLATLRDPELPGPLLPADAVAAVRLTEAAQRSAAEGRPVRP